MLDELKQSLAKHKVVLNVEYSNTLHDREIRFGLLFLNFMIAHLKESKTNLSRPQVRQWLDYQDWSRTGLFPST